MIKRLELKNIALINHAIIDFEKGLNVLSGETGSGKSVIVDSINFVLGAKADKSMIRYGESECYASVLFGVRLSYAGASGFGTSRSTAPQSPELRYAQCGFTAKQSSIAG